MSQFLLLNSSNTVVARIGGGTLQENAENNPSLTCIVDTFGIVNCLGMTYANGQLTGTPYPPPAKSPEAIKNEVVTATQQRLDSFAQSRQYDGILSACTYHTSPTPKFQVEGQYCLAQRDATWAKLYEILAEVEAGTRPMPQSFADIESELPALVWPT